SLETCRARSGDAACDVTFVDERPAGERARVGLAECNARSSHTQFRFEAQRRTLLLSPLRRLRACV
ncbi:MAG TPA: hypothetical protein VFQ61_25105, partial [Polyangiaceae bacterium]|nr:hypothetical protein [Polyangiaceae bacterium]